MPRYGLFPYPAAVHILLSWGTMTSKTEPQHVVVSTYEGLLIDTPHGELRLGELVHSSLLSRRHRASLTADPNKQHFEVLLIGAADDPGPLLGKGADPEICGCTIETVDLDGERALVFDTRGLTRIGDFIERPYQRPEDPQTESGNRAKRFEAIRSLAELLEIVHEIGDGLVAHADLELFALSTAGDHIVARLQRPELVSRRSSPPKPGSFIGSGLDAPEVTGLISRDIGVEADVYMLGMLAWAILTGVVPDCGLERFSERLPGVRAFDSGVPIGVDACLRRALKRAPKDRYSSVREFLAALDHALAFGSSRDLVGVDRRVWITHAAHSEIGRAKMVRYPVNQDAHLEIFDPKVGWGIFVTMDGVSRSTIGRGELASWLTSTAVEEGWNEKRKTAIYGKLFEDDNPYPANLLTSLASEADGKVVTWLKLLLSQPGTEPGSSTLCSTLSAVGIFRDRCAFCTAGDSPIYFIRLDADDPIIDKLSVDQSRALSEMRHGHSATAAMAHPGAAHLASAIGRIRWDGHPMVPRRTRLDVETWGFRLKPGDLVLVCSDGITGAFGRQASSEIFRILTETLGSGWDSVIRSEASLAGAVRALVRAADERGGRDNLTAVIVSIGPYCDEMEGIDS